MERLILQIPDLSCASCVPQIEQVMRQQEGVIWAMVNFAAGEATILYDPAAFTKHKLMQAVHQLGFQIEPIAESIRAHTTTIKMKPFERMQQWVHTLHIQCKKDFKLFSALLYLLTDGKWSGYTLPRTRLKMR